MLRAIDDIAAKHGATMEGKQPELVELVDTLKRIVLRRYVHILLLQHLYVTAITISYTWCSV
jgi:hypothetical protein